MAMLASVALCDLILPIFSRISGELSNATYTKVFTSLPEKILLALLFLSLIMGMQLFGMELSGNHVSNDTLQAFEWILSHTDEESRFLVLTGETAALEDFTNEWFPVLTRRMSVTTLQGLEWSGIGNFSNRILLLEEIQRCRLNQKILECAESLAEKSNLRFDYFLILRKSTDPLIPYLESPPLDEKRQYEIVYTSDDVFVLKNRNQASNSPGSANHFAD
jgi:hypothetical protein